MSETITKDALLKLVGEWIDRGKRTIGPTEIKPGHIRYARLEDSAALKLGGYIRPENSVKEFVFPKHEKLYRYLFEGKEISLAEADGEPAATVVVGSRPCDAAAFDILDRVFNWDFVDEQFNARRHATTIVTIACREWDDYCFCTSVGLGPAAPRGSDVLLMPLDGGAYEVRALTDAGRALFAGHTTPAEVSATDSAGPERKFEMEAVDEFLRQSWDSPLWRDQALRCLGCGACTYECPTCHCFDIVDEGNARGGYRARNWDACQFRMFTVHASGHNPRPDQPSRQRQRILHKFRIYPDKFGELLCTGCGNCGRACPVGLGVLNVLEAAAKAAVEG